MGKPPLVRPRMTILGRILGVSTVSILCYPQGKKDEGGPEALPLYHICRLGA